MLNERMSDCYADAVRTFERSYQQISLNCDHLFSSELKDYTEVLMRVIES